MFGLLLGVVTLLACYVLGARGLRLLKVSLEPDEELVLGTGIGLVFFGNFFALMGVSHLFNSVAFWVIFGVFLMLIVFEFQFLAQSFGALKKIYAVPMSPFVLFLVVISLISVLSCLMGVLSPEVANDSLCYHLHLPKVFLREGRLFMAPYELNTMYPFLMEMLYTFGLGLSGVTLAKFFHFGTGILAALAVFTWARQVADKKIAWGCALLFLTTPSVINEMSVTYVDVGMAFFSFLFLFAVWKWRQSPRVCWLAVSGIFAGACVGIKYLGIMILIPAFFIILFDRSSARCKVKGLFALGLAIILFGGLWYIRNFLAFGNPVFPYFRSVFGSGDPLIHNDYVGWGVPHTFRDFLVLPWTVTMQPGLFGGFGEQVGPGYLAFLPLLFWGFQGPFLGGISFFVAAYFFLWFLSAQMLRFLIPVLPILTVLMAAGWTRFGLGRLARRFMVVLFCVVLLMQTALSVYHYRKNFRVAAGLETRENYLLRNERSYRAAKFVNENLSRDAKVYMADETHLYYFLRSVARDVYFIRMGGLDRLLPPAIIIRRLRQEGFTHILYAIPETQAAGKSTLRDFSVAAMIGRGELAPFLEPVFRDHYISPHGEPNYSYVLFKITSR